MCHHQSRDVIGVVHDAILSGDQCLMEDCAYMLRNFPEKRMTFYDQFANAHPEVSKVISNGIKQIFPD